MPLYDYECPTCGAIFEWVAKFDEELKCELETQRHDNLYQLSFYLYKLGNLQDVYRIYNAKFEVRNMDVGMSMDREMLYLNNKIA